ncbi:MAG: uroporphyrinogen decarboxylase family protein [Christensenellales bacterium]
MIHGDPTFAIPDGNGMMDFSVRLFEDGDNLKKEAQKNLEAYLEMAERYRGKGLDGFALCSDYCFNTNPFMSPDQFGEFVAPYLEKVLSEYRAMGYYSIKHTDGNIMPILDMMVECKPDAIHSLDPQGGVDLGEVSDKYGDKVCLIGNVNCALLQNGTEEEIEKDVRRSLSQGMKRGKGYVFATSNCVYTGLPLERYELMMKIYEKYGTYDEVK